MSKNEEQLIIKLMDQLRKETAIGHFPEAHISAIEKVITDWLINDIFNKYDKYADIRERVRQRLNIR